MKHLLLKTMMLACLLFVGMGAWAQSTTLFHETFGDNSGSARNWSDTYSVKSGVAAVYSGITGYTVSNAKQGKNSTGSTASGLNQTTAGTDAYIIIGPLNVANYANMSLKYQWNAASTKKTYTTKLYYATSSTGSYTEITGGTGNGATTFVERSYSVPVAAQVSTLYLKIVWNTSNAQAIIDEVDLSGISASAVAAPTITASTNPVGPKTISMSAKAGSIYYTTDGTTPTSSSSLYSAPFVLTESATVKAIAIDNGESSSVNSLFVSIKAAATLPVSTYDAGSSGLGTGFVATDLGTDYSSSPKLKFDDKDDELVLGWNGEAKWMSFDIKGNSYSGGTFKVFTSADGISYNEVASYTSLASIAETKAFALNSTDRFIKWVYTNKSTGNVGLGNINVYNTNPTISLNAACTDGDYIYGTYSSQFAWVVPSDIIVAEVGVLGGELVVDEYDSGDIVPANTGVMVSSDAADSYEIVPTTAAGTSVLGNENCLRPTGAGITRAAMGAADANSEFFRLTMHNGDQIGFWWGAENGAAFDLGANKAYLAVSTDNLGLVAGARLWFGEETAIKAVKSESSNAAIYNLAGQRISKMQKGINIVNGKKIIK